jgi:shikimate dehydrogenase
MTPEPTYTLADLDHWPTTGTSLAVLGHPIRHSLSPAMHNAALASMAQQDPRFATWRYVRFDIPPEDLAVALAKLHARGFLGLNLTVPHKILAVDSIASIDPAARSIGAVNTLHRTAAGWHGYNTDGYGMATAIRETLGIPLKNTPVTLLGAGGAARGAAVECLQQGCAGLWIANRTRATLDTLLAQLVPLAHGIPLHGFDPASLTIDLPTAARPPAGALVINATSAGLNPTDPLPLDLSVLASHARPSGVFDMIYNPPVTPLLAQAHSLGLPAANGLAMLVHQGARALQIWSQNQVPANVMHKAVTAALASH